jgi:hypothetical protein
MKRLMGTAGLLLLLAGGQAEAQILTRPLNPYTRPPVSPYLNLIRGGNPAINYYGLVRPELDSIAAMQQLGQQAYAPLPPVVPTASVVATGHPAVFMNFSHYYYQNLGQTTPAGGRTLNTGPISPYGIGAFRR